MAVWTCNTEKNTNPIWDRRIPLPQIIHIFKKKKKKKKKQPKNKKKQGEIKRNIFCYISKTRGTVIEINWEGKTEK